jgi:glycosyltransferase involved in cell wall biosynthesis
MPLTSIIIPAYNVQRTIQETIRSVQNQTVDDFEIIVINDGSTDDTLAVLESIDDPRLKIFSYENGGLSTARNRGIQNATGEYISFVDADDLWTPDKLERQLLALKSNTNAKVAYSWTPYVFRETFTSNYCLAISFPVGRTFLSIEMCLPMWAYLIQLSILQKIGISTFVLLPSMNLPWSQIGKYCIGSPPFLYLQKSIRWSYPLSEL